MGSGRRFLWLHVGTSRPIGQISVSCVLMSCNRARGTNVAFPLMLGALRMFLTPILDVSITFSHASALSLYHGSMARKVHSSMLR